MINLYFIDYYNQLNNNGLNTYSTELLKVISTRNEIKVTIVWVNSSAFKATSKIVDGPISHFHIPKANYKDHDLAIASLILTDFKDKENLLVHLNWINHAPIAWHLKQKCNVKIILTKHCLPWRDLIVHDYPTFYALNIAYENRKKANISHPQLKREILGYDWIDHIITVTQSAKYSLSHLFDVDINKISVVYNGLDPDTFKKIKSQKSKKELRKKYGFDMEEKIILYAGKITYSKGIFDIVKIFDDISNTKGFKKVRLVIAGDGTHSSIFKAVSKSFGSITVTGNLDKPTLYDFFAMSDIGVIPSFTEQCSYSCIEMMYSGLPLMVSDVDGLKELISNERGIKIKIDFKKNGASINKQDFIEKLRFLLTNEKQAQYFAVSSKKFAEQNLNASRMADETAAIYKNQLLLARSNYDGELLPQSPNGPLVSILVPCYNVAKYLKDCITSVLKQTYSNFELILVNDGSTDQTDLIIGQIDDSRMIYIKNTSNKGITYSLNKLIKRASGKYIIRMDGDDIMEQDRVQKQVDFLEKNPEFGMIGSSYTIINETGMPVNTVNYSFDDGDLKILLLFFNPFAHPTIAMRSEIAKKLLYDKDYLHCEDYELWFRIAKEYKVTNLNDRLMKYRIHNGNTSLQHNALMKKNVINLLSRELDKIGVEHSTQELVVHAAISFRYGTKYFNSAEKISALNNWLNKIFSAKTIKKEFAAAKLAKMKEYILSNNCGVS